MIESLYKIATALKFEVNDLLPPMSWYMKYKDKRIKRVVIWEIEDEDVSSYDECNTD